MNKNKKFSKKIMGRIGMAILVITPLLVGLFFVRSLIKTTTDTIVSSRKQFSEKASSLNALVSLQNQYKNFGKVYLNVLHNVIPIKDELINISRELESLATANNIDFGFSFQGEKNPTGEELGYLKYSLNIEGSSINQIQNFVEDLNDFKYINSVDSLSIKRKIEGETERISSRIEGRVYFRSNNI